MELDKVKLLKRLWKHSIESEGHWLWLGSTSRGGHGKMTLWHRQFEVSRVSAAIHLGLDITDPNELACHKPECNRKHCWNPNHLYVGDKVSNMIDYMDEHGANGYYKRGKRWAW